MKDTLELPEQTDLELSTDNSDIKMKNSLHTVKQWKKENKELRKIIKGTLDQEYIDKYIKFSKHMQCVLNAVEEFIKDVDAISEARPRTNSKNTCISENN